MANYFDEERINCDKCGGQLFEMIQSTMLLKEGNKIVQAPYKEYARCITCGELIDLEERK